MSTKAKDKSFEDQLGKKARRVSFSLDTPAQQDSVKKLPERMIRPYNDLVRSSSVSPIEQKTTSKSCSNGPFSPESRHRFFALIDGRQLSPRAKSADAVTPMSETTPSLTASK